MTRSSGQLAVAMVAVAMSSLLVGAQAPKKSATQPKSHRVHVYKAPA